MLGKNIYYSADWKNWNVLWYILFIQYTQKIVYILKGNIEIFQIEKITKRINIINYIPISTKRTNVIEYV